MDSLIDEIGKGPYQIKTLVSVYESGRALLGQIQQNGPRAAMDVLHTTATIEKLEALASICFRSLELDSITYTMDFSQASLTNLTATIWELKQALFGDQVPSSDRSNVCDFCGWALQRVGAGLIGTTPWTLRNGPPFVANCYLCALDTWPRFPGLEASAQTGCDLCSFLRDLIKKRKVQLGPPHSASQPTKVGVWIDFRYGPRQKDTSRMSGTGGLLNSFTSASVFLSTLAWWTTPVWPLVIESRDKEVVQEMQVFTHPDTETWSPVNVNLVQSYLNGAVAEVEPIPTAPAFTPTRLLDLGASQGADIKLKIADTAVRSKKSVMYAALSYCWGPPEDALKQSKLTTANIAGLCQRIANNQLSPVMRDAITVCRRLGIRYLWIDALCIIQDSKTDWELESQQMSHVYEGAYLTICAIASSSCFEGFLATRPAWSEYRYTSPIKSAGPSHKAFFSLRPVSGYDQETGYAAAASSAKAPLDQDLFASRWNERGWVFQEKSISPRKLYFGKSMLHLQLGRTVVSENGHTSVLKPHSYDAHEISDTTIPIGPLISSGRHPHELWHAMVVNFVHLQWTDTRDVFPGLSGAAAKFHQVLYDDTYLAGHWVKDLACSLIWTTFKRGGIKRPESLEELTADIGKGNALHAPSWSWASRPDFFRFVLSTLDNRRCRVRTHLRQEFSLLSSNLVVDGVNPFGRLKNGASNSLSVSGRTIKFPDIFAPEWRLDEQAEWNCQNRDKGYLILVSHDWTPDKRKGYAFWDHDSGRRPPPPRGTTEDQLSKLRLLLLSSCCSDDSLETPPVQLTPEVATGVLFRPEYGKTFLDDPDFRAQDGTCSHCRDNKRNRDVWGLLLYPAADADGWLLPGTYYRVGVFFCRAQHGGSSLFREAEVCRIELF
ncbi:heterokaryon incompatibility protein-domain-containing protein [Podospora didyma]|uniref:Heterokaryon incompatibility protein-domain-containing protein n=1 Tax=Podospora didyma TaxID=330526 RepID=A0AAE0NZZ7_9PEZI|nr:heterokaryon incompatibility protein-domain-containing protein [Podospora didyma]